MRFCENIINTGRVPPSYRWFPNLESKDLSERVVKEVLDEFRDSGITAHLFAAQNHEMYGVKFETFKAICERLRA